MGSPGWTVEVDRQARTVDLVLQDGSILNGRVVGVRETNADDNHDRRRPYRLTEVGAATLQAQLDAQRRVAEVGLRRLAQGWGLT